MTTDAKTEAEAFLKLQEAATAGPWRVHQPRRSIYIKSHKQIVAEPYPYGVRNRNDADLMVAARNTALPKLTLELAAENERLRELIRDADHVTKERFTLDGLCDCIDNNGRPYQSDWAAKIIKALQEPSR